MERTRALVFLDLYDNALRSVDGLDAVPGLRVLMLGRNEIQVVDGLSHCFPYDRVGVVNFIP
jgi:leucine-rich repeat-containing protein 49